MHAYNINTETQISRSKQSASKQWRFQDYIFRSIESPVVLSKLNKHLLLKGINQYITIGAVRLLIIVECRVNSIAP